MPKGPQGQKRKLTLSAAMGGGVVAWIALGKIVNYALPDSNVRFAIEGGSALVLITLFAMLYLALSSDSTDD